MRIDDTQRITPISSRSRATSAAGRRQDGRPPKQRSRRGCGGWWLLLFALGALWWFREPLLHRIGWMLTAKENLSEASLAEKAASDEPLRAYLVTALDSEAPLAAKNADQPIAPASLAKLFTVEYALSLCDWDELIPVESDTLALIEKDASSAHLEPGFYTLRNLITATLVPSGSDAAMAIAVHIGRKLAGEVDPPGARDRFLEGLRTHLEETGRKATRIDHPAGFLPSARSTANDLLSVTKALLKDPIIRAIVESNPCETRLPNGQILSWENTNRFLHAEDPRYDAHVRGVKTGSLDQLNHLITLYEKDGREWLMLALGAPTDEARYEQTQRLIEHHLSDRP